MESKTNRGQKNLQDQKLANPHAITPAKDLETIRKAVYQFEQYLKKCTESKGTIRAHEEVQPILKSLQELSNAESKNDEETRKQLRELLIQLIQKESPNSPNQLLFDAAYEFLFIWTKYWPKNKENKKGQFICFLNGGEPIEKEEERFVFPILGYQYKANDLFFNLSDPSNNKGFFACEENGGIVKLHPRDLAFLKKEAIRRGELQPPPLPPAPPPPIPINDSQRSDFIASGGAIGYGIGVIVVRSVIPSIRVLSHLCIFCVLFSLLMGSILVGALIGFGLYKLREAYNRPMPAEDLQPTPYVNPQTVITEKLLNPKFLSSTQQKNKTLQDKKDEAPTQQMNRNVVEFKPTQSPLVAYAVTTQPKNLSPRGSTATKSLRADM